MVADDQAVARSHQQSEGEVVRWVLGSAAACKARKAHFKLRTMSDDHKKKKAVREAQRSRLCKLQI